MTKDNGIRALIPGVVLASEEKEINDAREYIRKKLGIRKDLPAAPNTLVSNYLPSRIIEKLPEKKNPPISPTLFQDTLPGKNIKNFAQKNNLKGKVIIDSKHPDGFRLAEDNDLYKNYGDTPVRYIQEIKYKYDGGDAPTDSIVKKFDSFYASTFPSDPAQKKALAKYQVMYDKLSPLQKKQLETTQKLKKK